LKRQKGKGVGREEQRVDREKAQWGRMGEHLASLLSNLRRNVDDKAGEDGRVRVRTMMKRLLGCFDVEGTKRSLIQRRILMSMQGRRRGGKRSVSNAP